MHQQIESKIQALEEAKTKLEKSEEKLKNQNVELDKKVEERTKELNKLLEDKDRFITILGHDLKSPFNSILGILYLLEDNLQKLSGEQIEQHVKAVSKSAQKVYNLLEDILLWVRAQSGKLPFIPENLGLANLVNEVIDYLEPSLNMKEQKFQLLVKKDVLVFADRNMLQTILRNLIYNAIKFTNKGGRISISANINDVEVTVIVTDTGVGMIREQIEQLFDNTEIIPTLGTEKEKGTGLGLLICKEFIETHGGKIWVESEPGKGSDFKFTLPLKKL
jgi:two-component system sensor histidine kinase/response regulator